MSSKCAIIPKHGKIKPTEVNGNEETTHYVGVKSQNLVNLRNFAARFTADRQLTDTDILEVDIVPQFTDRDIKLGDDLSITAFGQSKEIYVGPNDTYVIEYDLEAETATVRTIF